MSIKRISAVGLALAMVANSALGAGVQYFKSGEVPDPQRVATILSQPASPPPGLKLRSIRLIPSDDKTADVAMKEERPSDPVEAPKAAGRVALVAEASGSAAESASDAPPTIATPAATPPNAPTAVAAAPLSGPYAPSPVAAAAASVLGLPVARVAAADELPTSLALPVQFAFDSARILPGAYRQLDAVAAGIKLARPDARIVIEGHTDSVGSDRYNLRLSAERAYAVYDYLVLHHNINPARLRVVGMGKYVPLDRTHPTAPENRRVEFRAEA